MAITFAFLQIFGMVLRHYPAEEHGQPGKSPVALVFQEPNSVK